MTATLTDLQAQLDAIEAVEGYIDAAQLDRIRKLADRLDNGNTPLEEAALRNLVAGRPAFWTSGRSSGRGAMFAKYVNDEEGSILLAIGAIEFDYRGSPVDYRSADLLETLLPLNPAALSELEAAYLRCSTFRSQSELLDRTGKLEGSHIATLQAPRVPARDERENA